MAYVGISIPNTALIQRPGAQLHLTLAHFDKPTDEQSVDLALRLEPIAGHTPRFTFEKKELERWDSVGDVLLVTHSAQLRHLRESVLEAIYSVGIKITATYPFTPHITLGRADPEVWKSRAPNIKFPPISAWGQGLELCGTPVITRYYFPFEALSHHEVNGG